MINFNNSIKVTNKFLGSEKKATILYDNQLYMIKFPDPIREKNNSLSYMNNQFSEYIGCTIFKLCGFETQDVAIGTYTSETGKEKIVVACKDFTQDGSILYEFSKIWLSIETEESVKNNSIESVNLGIAKSNTIENKKEILSKFWDMFIIDTLIGNYDRHFDNWGLLEKEGVINFAPIYDCGSSLGALFSDDRMSQLLEDDTDFKNEEYNVKSCYTLNGKRIFYHEIFKDPIPDLSEAIKRIVPRIDMSLIHLTINSTVLLSDIRKVYLMKAIDLRYTEILLPAFKRITKKMKEYKKD